GSRSLPRSSLRLGALPHGHNDSDKERPSADTKAHQDAPGVVLLRFGQRHSVRPSLMRPPTDQERPEDETDDSKYEGAERDKTQALSQTHDSQSFWVPA